MRIVLVDPSRVVQQAMTRLIEQDKHEVVPFADGLEALARVTLDDNVRAVITSTQPLNISGIDLCAAVRELTGARRAVHTILMSSTTDLHLMVLALDKGADDFIRKPPIADELRARLRLADRVTSMKHQLIRYATTDALTGLLNRRAFFEHAVGQCSNLGAGNVLSAIIFDIDHFKQINDQYGHEAGDHVLKRVGAELKVLCPQGARLGGEEFCALIPGQAADALECATEVQRTIRALTFANAAKTFAVTCSFGISEREAGDTIDRMLRRADIAMYQAKRSGRDRIVLSDTYMLTAEHDQWSGTARIGRRLS